MNLLAVQAVVATTTISHLARYDEKGASSLPLDLAGKILTVLEVCIGDLLEVAQTV